MTCYLEIDIAALIGTCESERESCLPLDGASNGRFLFAEGRPNQLTTTVQGKDYTTIDCSDEGTVSITQDWAFKVTGETTLNGVGRFRSTANSGRQFSPSKATNTCSRPVGTPHQRRLQSHCRQV